MVFLSFLFPLSLLIVTAAFVFAYHYERNGIPWKVGDLVSRLIWAITFGLGYILLSVQNIDFRLLGVYIAGAFVEILIPHAFAQNMGRFGRPWTLGAGNVALPWSKYWPGSWLPHDYSLTEWQALSGTFKFWLDFLGMTSTAILRGIVVFFPAVYFGVSWTQALVAAGITALWQPLSYAIGWHVPLNWFGNTKDDATWGEFFVGIGWAIALAVTVILL